MPIPFSEEEVPSGLLVPDASGNYDTAGGNLNAANVTGSGIIEVGKNTNGVSHINKARIESDSFGPGSIASFSHHDCQLGNNIALVQTEAGETWVNSETGRTLTFRIGGQEKVRLDTNGNFGINQQSPTTELDVGGSITATGSTTSGVASMSSDSGLAKMNHTSQTDVENAAICQDVNGNTFINAGKNSSQTRGRIYFTTGINTGDSGDTRMIILNDGKVGIGMGGNPTLDEKLHVGGNIKATGSIESGVMKSLGVIYSSTATTKEWKIYAVSNGNLHFDFQTGNGNFVQKGFLNQAVNVNDIDFTGQHRSKFEGDFTSELVGLIVESTGAYLELDGSVKPKIDEALPSVKLTTAAKCKRVYGVLSNIEGDTREYGSGFVTVVPKDDNITRVVVNSVGEGSLWVINTRDQSLENGDYICSSSVAGYGEKQDDDILHSYTVAKITMALDWSNLPDWLETRNVTASGEVSETGAYKAAFVGVTYHCG